MGHKTRNDDELVKHMSKIPGFLQRVEKKNSIQDKALNFGVLDWNRLESWKYNERMPGKYTKKTALLSSHSVCSTSGPPKTAPNLRKQVLSSGPNPSSYSAPVARGSRFGSPQRRPLPSYNSHLHSSKEERNVTQNRKVKYAEGVNSKGKETYEAAQGRSTYKPQDNVHQKVIFYDTSCSNTMVDSRKRQDSEENTISQKEASSSDQCKDKLPLSPHDKVSSPAKKSETTLDDNMDSTSECWSEYLHSSELPAAKDFPKRCSSETFQFRNSLDEQLTGVEGNRLSYCFSPQDFYSGELSVDIPHSCPLPSGATICTEAAVHPHMLVDSQETDSLNFTSECQGATFVTSAPSDSKSLTTNEKNTRPSLSPETPNKTKANVAEQPSVKGRTPSPTRRFSFSIGRMSRSLSFKESSAFPRFSAEYTPVKSGPVGHEGLSHLDNSQKDKAHSSGKGRSSPLRRLLDPLLKHKAAQSPVTVRPPNGSKDSTTSRAPSHNRKPNASTLQALLQLTLKNGLPFFKLVIDNSSEMLAAAVRKLPRSGKNDSCLIYAFYSVHEVKKKTTNWMGQGSKSKICSLGYNIVGQMKISSSCHSVVNIDHLSECDARECVLYGVDPGNMDKQTPEITPNKEIAAIVVKKSVEILNDAEETKNCSGMTVLLPGGVHGVPIKGTPSSLISRWRSGGSCDCGGWDIGCKLKILGDYNCSSDIHGESVPSSVTDRLNLFLQGGGRSSRPVFSLEPFNDDFYSIELDTSVSLLEAFATCVAYFTCRNFSEILDVKESSDADNSKESVMGINRTKIPATFHEQVPTKYMTCPPLSPVGRI